MTTPADFKPGDRVELAPHLDLWMLGARYGTVTRITRTRVHVQLDRLPGTPRRFWPDDLRRIEQ